MIIFIQVIDYRRTVHPTSSHCASQNILSCTGDVLGVIAKWKCGIELPPIFNLFFLSHQ